MRTPTRLVGMFTLLFAITGCAASSAPVEVAPRGVSPSPTSPALASATPTGVDTGVGSVHSINQMLTARAAHAATLLPDGEVLITGGFGQGDDAYSAGAELFDPVTDDFVSAEKMTVGRCCHTATRLLDGRVLIAGGFNNDYLAGAEIYDPATAAFTPTGPLTTPRMDHVAVLLDDGKVLLAGGVGAGWTFLAGAEVYDPATGVFTPTGDMTAARESHTATKLPDGRVLIAGGHQGRHSAIVIYDSAEIYDPATGIFTPAGQMLVRRHKHDAVLLADGRVLLSGGSDEHDDQNAYTSAEIYDPASGVFSPAGDMPTVRYKHAGTSLLLKDGNVLIAGGARNAVLYDPRRNTFDTVPGSLGTATLSRLFSTATLLPNGSVLITGGYGLGQEVSAQAWVYNP